MEEQNLVESSQLLKCVKDKTKEDFMGLVRLRSVLTPSYASLCVTIQQLPLSLALFPRPPPPTIFPSPETKEFKREQEGLRNIPRIFLPDKMTQDREGPCSRQTHRPITFPAPTCKGVSRKDENESQTSREEAQHLESPLDTFLKCVFAAPGSHNLDRDLTLSI